jgi:hypothetical protein
MQCLTIPDTLEALHRQKVDHPASLDDLLIALKKLASDTTHIYIILDALDECTDVQGLTSMFRAISGWGLPSMRIFVASRYETPIQEVLEPISAIQKLNVHGQAIQDDISTYIRQRMKSSKFWQKRPDIFSEVQNALVEKGGDM